MSLVNPKAQENMHVIADLVTRANRKLSADLSQKELDAFANLAANFAIRNQSVDSTFLFNWVYTRIGKYLEYKQSEAFRSNVEHYIRMPKDRIIYGENTNIHKLVERGFEPDFSAVDNLPSAAVRKFTLVLDSRFRNIVTNPTSNRFTMKFVNSSANDPTRVFVAGTTLVGSELPKRIVRLTVTDITLPDIISSSNTSTDLPYILLDFPETSPNKTFTSLTQTPVVFAKVEIDSEKTSAVSYRRMTNRQLPFAEWSTEVPWTISQLTPTFYNPNGSLLNFGVDALTTFAFTVANTSYTTGTGFITKTIEFTSNELINTDMTGKDVTFYQVATRSAYEDVGSAGVYYYAPATFDNDINGNTYVVNKTGDYTFTIDLIEPPVTTTTFPGNPALTVNAYGIGSGSAGYAIINSRQVVLSVEIVSLQ